jgi:hypothetical protein
MEPFWKRSRPERCWRVYVEHAHFWRIAMIHAFTSIDNDQHSTVDSPRRPARARSVSEVLVARDTAEGAFSLVDDEPLTIAAEEGLVIRVRSGCLWVPSCEEHCSVGVSEGDRFICKRDETLRVLGCRGTEIELDWPARDRSPISMH